MPEQKSRPQLSVLDGIMLVVGLVVGISILRAPASIASSVSSPAMMMWAWVLGGLFAACGAFCYAHLAKSHPDNGGEYSYLRHSLGELAAFLFAWTRMTVLQTGSIAAASFIYGDYATRLWNLGHYSSLIHTGYAVIGLTTLNALGLHLGRTAQNLLTLLKIAGLTAVVIAGLTVDTNHIVPVTPAATGASTSSFGLAMVFILYAYGGWNEASYLAGDMKRGSRSLAVVLFTSTAAILLIYLIVNAAYLRALGFDGLRQSTAPASDVMAMAFGKAGEVILAILASVIALGSANATTLTGARSIHALGINHHSLRWLSLTNTLRNTPANAYLSQGIITLALVMVAGLFGDNGRHGFEVAVEYTAPAFWGFMVLIGLVALKKACNHNGIIAGRLSFIIAALVFMGICSYMLYSSIAYAGLGAIVGLVIITLGVPAYHVVKIRDTQLAIISTEPVEIQ